MIHIAGVIRHIRHVVLVLDPYDAAVALSRMWCLFEIMHAHLVLSGLSTPGAGRKSFKGDARAGPRARSGAGGGSFHLAMPFAQRERLLRALNRAPEDVESALTSFDMRGAQASVPADRALIMEAIVSRFAPSGLSTAQLRMRGQSRGLEDAAAAIEAFNAVVRGAISAALAGLSWRLGSTPSVRSAAPRVHSPPEGGAHLAHGLAEAPGTATKEWTQGALRTVYEIVTLTPGRMRRSSPGSVDAALGPDESEPSPLISHGERRAALDAEGSLLAAPDAGAELVPEPSTASAGNSSAAAAEAEPTPSAAAGINDEPLGGVEAANTLLQHDSSLPALLVVEREDSDDEMPMFV